MLQPLVRDRIKGIEHYCISSRATGSVLGLETMILYCTVRKKHFFHRELMCVLPFFVVEEVSRLTLRRTDRIPN